MSVNLSRTDYKLLKNMLRDYFSAGNQPTPFLAEAFAGSPEAGALQGKINLGFAPNDLAGEIITKVSNFGRDTLGRESLSLVIDALKENTGDVKKHDELDRLVWSYKMLSSVDTGTELGEPALERVIRKNLAFVDLEVWLQRVEQIKTQVCRVEIAVSGGTVFGTGFLVRPDVVITNYHVVEDVIVNTAKPEGIVLRFDYKRLPNGTINPGKVYRVKAGADWLIDSSDYRPNTAPDMLDYALLRVDGIPGEEVVGASAGGNGSKRSCVSASRQPYAFQKDSAMFIVQHPMPDPNSQQSEPMKWAIDTSAIIEAGPTRVRYRTNTEAGSSGSPCFNMDGNLIALHHSGDPTKIMSPKWNEGIPFTAIIDMLSQHKKLDAISVTE